MTTWPPWPNPLGLPGTGVRSGAYEYAPNFFAPAAVIDPDAIPDVKNSDHLAFWERGYPALLVTDTAYFRNPNYHTPNDTVDTLNIGFMAHLDKGDRRPPRGAGHARRRR